MAYTTIDDPSAHFQINAYTGDGNDDRNLVNTGNSNLQPDWVWIKCRSAAKGHNIFDSSRGTSAGLSSDNENEEFSDGNRVQAFQTDGFQLGSNSNVNENTTTFVAWQWKANGGTTSSFTESSNNPGGTIQTNTDAGFSIITTTGTGGAGTISHGLGAVPHWIISKGRSNSGGWVVYHRGNTSAPETDALNLSSNGATVDAVAWFNDTAPTSSVFTVGTTNDINGDGRTYIHYVFTEIQGYSKFGSYAGNNSTDGPFVYTGFTPAWVMIKRTDGGTNNWPIWDYERGVYNGARAELYANLNNAEATDSAIDILSNGFKLRNASTEWNNGTNYIYMAFAKHPFVSSKGVPTTAV